MTIQSNFPAIMPSLDLNFANAKVLDPRITFTRASTATYYDGKTVAKAEENLVLQSQTFDNASWTKANGTVTADAVVAPDGTTTADLFTENTATAEHNLLAVGASSIANVPMVFSVYIKPNGRTIVRLDWANNGGFAVTATLTGSGTINSGTGTVTALADGWYRLALTITPTNAQATFRIKLCESVGVTSYTGDGTSGIYLWGAQLEQRSSATAYTPTTTQPITNYIPVLLTAAAGVPRFEHNPITGESLGLLIEEQRTNLQVNSEDFTSADWVKSANTTITANQNIAPDGTLTADTFGYTAITSGSLQVSDNQTKAASAITYTGSIYVKASSGLYLHFYVDANTTANSGRVIVDTSNWTVFSSTNSGTFTGTSGTVTPVGNGWYRISCTTTSGTETNIRFNLYWSTSSFTVTFTPVGTENVFIWGAQLEVGAFPTSYIKTEASQVTRSADAASMTGTNFTSWYRADEGTVYSESLLGYTIPASVFPIVAAISDASVSSNRIAVFYEPSGGNRLRFQGTSAGAGQWDIAGVSAVVAVNQLGKSAGAYKVNDIGFACNTVLVGTDTGANLPIVDRFIIGSTATGTFGLNGTIKRLTYYPARLTNAQLQAITG